MADLALNETREVSVVDGASDNGNELAINADGSINVVSSAAGSLVSTVNSSTITLGVSGVFTGTFENVKNYSVVTIIVFSNVASANDGLSFQWSSDGTNIDRTEASSVLASTGRAFAITVRGQYFRIVYTNGTTAQTTFRLQTVYRSTGTGLITKPLDVSLSSENFALLTQSVIAGESNGGFENVKTTSGRLRVINTTNDESKTEAGEIYSVVYSFLVATVFGNTLYLLRNPSGSGKVLTVVELAMAADDLTDDQVRFSLFKTPTVTSVGTVLTPVNTHIGSSNSPSALIYRNPVVSSVGTEITREHFTKSTSSKSAFGSKIQLDGNQDLLVYGGQIGTTAHNWTVTLLWSERNA